MIPIALAAGIILFMALGAMFVLGFQSPKPHAESRLADLDALAMAAVESNDVAKARVVLADLEAELKKMGDAPPLGSQATYTALKNFVAHGGQSAHSQGHQ